jgi:signal peptidase I
VEVDKTRKSPVRECIETIVIALIAALFIRTFVVQAFKIPSGSMIPTLQIGDHILVWKLTYGIRIPFWGNYVVRFKQPSRGDVVVFVYPVDRSKDFIKRVIGKPGDQVEIRKKKVFINGVVVEDPYAHFEDAEISVGGNQIRDNYGPVRVPENHVFVMGDNRDRSYDSRFWGFVNLQDLKGKAFVIYWSWDGSDRWVRWERIFDLIY